MIRQGRVSVYAHIHEHTFLYLYYIQIEKVYKIAVWPCIVRPPCVV